MTNYVNVVTKLEILLILIYLATLDVFDALRNYRSSMQSKINSDLCLRIYIRNDACLVAYRTTNTHGMKFRRATKFYETRYEVL